MGRKMGTLIMGKQSGWPENGPVFLVTKTLFFVKGIVIRLFWDMERLEFVSMRGKSSNLVRDRRVASVECYPAWCSLLVCSISKLCLCIEPVNLSLMFQFMSSFYD